MRPPSPTQTLLLQPWASVLPASALLLPLLLALLQLIAGMSHSSSAHAMLLLLLLQLVPQACAAVLPTHAVLHNLKIHIIASAVIMSHCHIRIT
jgi:hypothetical protein